VSDIDQVILTVRQTSLEPFETGLVGYHLDFPGRTTPIVGSTASSADVSICQLRQDVVPWRGSLDQTPDGPWNGLGVMAEHARKRGLVAQPMIPLTWDGKP
jgi:hypothetical protein